MTKKDVECQVHTWMIKKGKKAMVYKARKDRRKKNQNKKKKEKTDFQGMSEETYCYISCSYLYSFYTKIQYFGLRSD